MNANTTKLAGVVSAVEAQMQEPWREELQWHKHKRYPKVLVPTLSPARQKPLPPNPKPSVPNRVTAALMGKVTTTWWFGFVQQPESLALLGMTFSQNQMRARWGKHLGFRV